MQSTPTFRFLTLLQRELQEYRNSLLWTPIITALLLALLMLGSVVLADRVSVVGDTILDALMREGNSNVSVSVTMGEDGEEEVRVVEVARPGQVPPPPAAGDVPDYEVFVEQGGAGEEWNFSREWRFEPDREPSGDSDEEDDFSDGREINVMLGVVHGILLIILILASVNYLLGSLFDDRKDRSILFWRSMPVAESQVVLSKLVTALVVAPLIYLAVSLLLQLAYVLLMMLLVWRLNRDPFAVVVENIDFLALTLDPLSGWIMTALLIAPSYAWLLCASALAKRSPFLMAVTPVIALFAAEGLFIGTEYFGDAVARHVPHLSDDSSMAFYLFGPDWTRLDLASVAGGLLFTAAALAATVWLRKNRWELN